MAVFCRVSLFCQVFFPSLPSDLFSAFGKEFSMPSAIILPSVISTVLGKQLFCRVSNKIHSVNIPVSGSDRCLSSIFHGISVASKILGQ